MRFAVKRSSSNSRADEMDPNEGAPPPSLDEKRCAVAACASLQNVWENFEFSEKGGLRSLI